jgi:hypothetical protein
MTGVVGLPRSGGTAPIPTLIAVESSTAVQRRTNDRCPSEHEELPERLVFMTLAWRFQRGSVAIIAENP